MIHKVESCEPDDGDYRDIVDLTPTSYRTPSSLTSSKNIFIYQHVSTPIKKQIMNRMYNLISFALLSKHWILINYMSSPND
jgi:hypothetical protein